MLIHKCLFSKCVASLVVVVVAHSFVQRLRLQDNANGRRQKLAQSISRSVSAAFIYSTLLQNKSPFGYEHVLSFQDSTNEEKCLWSLTCPVTKPQPGSVHFSSLVIG